MSSSGMYTALGYFLSDGTTSGFAFNNIPVSNYAGLVLTAKMRQQSVSNFPYWSLTFNGDNTAGVYNTGSVFMSGYDYGSGNIGVYNTGDNQIYVIRNPEGTTSGDPRWAQNSFQYFQMVIPNASSSTQFKTARFSSVSGNNISTPYCVSNTGITYKSISPLTSISGGTSGNLTAGSEFILYGYGPI
jgi:hypothetical protein